MASSCSALVAVMKSTDLRDLHYYTEFRRLDGSRFGCIFVKRQMGSRMLVILEVRLQGAVQRRFVKHNDMIEAFATD